MPWLNLLLTVAVQSQEADSAQNTTPHLYSPAGSKPQSDGERMKRSSNAASWRSQQPRQTCLLAPVHNTAGFVYHNGHTTDDLRQKQHRESSGTRLGMAKSLSHTSNTSHRSDGRGRWKPTPRFGRQLNFDWCSHIAHLHDCAGLERGNLKGRGNPHGRSRTSIFRG